MRKQHLLAIGTFVVAAIAGAGLGYASSRQLGSALLEQLEIDELERIPVLAEEPS